MNNMNEENLTLYIPEEYERLLGRLTWHLHTTNRTLVLLEDLLKNTTYDCLFNFYQVNRDFLERMREELK